MIVPRNLENGDVVMVNTEFGCSFGCGNEFRFIVINVDEGETLMLCVPDYIRFSANIAAAITEPDNPAVQEAVEEYERSHVPPPGTRGRRAKREASGNGTGAESALDDFTPDTEEIANGTEEV